MSASLLQFGDVYSADLLTEKVKQVTVEKVIEIFKKYWLDENYVWIAVVGPDEESEVVFNQINY